MYKPSKIVSSIISPRTGAL